MRERTLLAAALWLGCLAAPAQTDVQPLVPGSTVEGVAYFLPRTALRVTVVADKTVTRPGDFNKYAERYLRLQGVPREETTEWAIKSVTLEPVGVPDKGKAFSIRLKGRTVAPLVGLSRGGILLSINTDAEEEALPALPLPSKGAAPENPRAYMTQEILAAGSAAKMAELCAQEIYDIRESRNALTRGEADNTPKDGAQLQLMLASLDKQAAALESLFRGTRQTDTEVFSLMFDPRRESEGEVLFRFSRRLGVVDKDDLAGEPVYVSVKPLESVPDAAPSEETARKKEKMERGVYYNVPARVRATVTLAGRELASLETPMGQFGAVELLSNTLFDKKTTTKVTFFQSTGGVKDIME